MKWLLFAMGRFLALPLILIWHLMMGVVEWGDYVWGYK